MELIRMDELPEARRPDFWRERTERHLNASGRFELHCWSDETDEIRAALAYGRTKETGWAYGTVIEGPVTPEFVRFLLSRPKPPANDLESDRMTPYFTIFLDDGFSSEHYGAELYEPE